MKITVILFIFITACAKDNSDGPQSGLLISSIPEGCARYESPHNTSGYHEFTKDSGNILMADGYDCGMREGKTCSYYVHNPDSVEHNFIQDIRCE